MKNMKLMRASGILSLAALAVITGSSAMADDAGWYGGINFGRSIATIDQERITASLLGAGFTTTSFNEDNRNNGYKLFGAYRFDTYFALEVAAFDLGHYGYTATTSPAGTLNGKIEVSGYSIDPVVIWPLTEKLSALGRFGLSHTKAEDTFSGTGAVILTRNPSPRERDWSYKFGLGLHYDFTDDFGMRAEAERFRINDAVGNLGDIDLFSLGLVVGFGGSEPAPAPRTAFASAPIEDPIPARTERYCGILDIEFDINRDTIQREEKERLAVVGTFLKKYPETTAVIEGHTDDVGSDEVNLKLSQERADSVVAYLVDELRIAPSRLKAVGYGETRPIASNSTADGKKRNRRIHAVIPCARDIEGLTVVPARVTLAVELEFDPYKFEIEPQYRDNLAHVARFLKANPSVTATVEGHANKFVGTGSGEVQLTPEGAMEISKRRAQSVVNYLVDNHGIARSRLTAEGFGQTRRVTYGDTLGEQQENRRVNIILNYPNR